MSVLTRAQSNPEIGTDDSSFVTELVNRARDFVVSYCGLPAFPELSQARTVSRASVSTDLTSLASGVIYLYLNGSPRTTISLTLANCDTGDNTATELQAQIRAIGASTDLYGYDEVTATFDSDLSQYTITSGRYGPHGSVVFQHEEATKHLALALGLTTEFGARVYDGMDQDDVIETATVELIEQLYRRVGVEGLMSYAMHQGEFSAAVHHICEPTTLAMLRSRRRLW